MEVLRWGVLSCLAYLAVVTLIDVLLLGFAALENSLRSHQSRVENLEGLRSSRFAIPVSVVVPVFNEEAVVVPVVRSLLELDYPEFEVVVVDDGSTDATLALLREEFRLEPRAAYERQVFSRGDEPRVYRSASDPITVVHRDADHGSKAEALNYGLDFSRYPFMCCVDGDTIYSRDALLKAMAPVHRDPDHVVGVTGRIGVATRPERNGHGKHELAEASLLGAFQHLEYLRSFLNDRLAWSRLRFMLCTSGAFMLYRRDVLAEVGGFSPDFSCEDLEITFRIHERFLREGRDYKILALPDKVGTTEGPGKVGHLVEQRARWQRVTHETLWHYRHMFGNRRYGPVGLIGVPFLFLSEALAPIFEVLGVATVIGAAFLGVFTWHVYFAFFVVISFVNGLLSSAAVWLEDVSARSYRPRDLVRFLLLGPLELAVYRPILMWARVKGTVGFLRGERKWGKFERNSRAGHSGGGPLPELGQVDG